MSILCYRIVCNYEVLSIEIADYMGKVGSARVARAHEKATKPGDCGPATIDHASVGP